MLMRDLPGNVAVACGIWLVLAFILNFIECMRMGINPLIIDVDNPFAQAFPGPWVLIDDGDIFD
jgi:hypothetical protein